MNVSPISHFFVDTEMKLKIYLFVIVAEYFSCFGIAQNSSPEMFLRDISIEADKNNTFHFKGKLSYLR